MGGICRTWKRRSVSALVLTAAVVCTVIGFHAPVSAEGTGQFNEVQTLKSNTMMYADITTVGQTIDISVCTNTTISIWNTNGTPNVTSDDTALVTNASFTANLACGSTLPNPVTGAYKYSPASVGTYRFKLANNQARYDFSVSANSTVNPNPNTASGRIWSYTWNFSTGDYTLPTATNVDLYVLTPASTTGQNFVWKLDLNNFAGNSYSLAANSQGLDAPYAGLSADQGSSTVTAQYPIYIGYPAIAGANNTTTPTISNARFVDDANEDSIFSPNGTVGIQDTGNFEFDTNVSNANYAITIDTNQDGVYGTGDRLLLGSAVNGANTVNWDGKYPNGTAVPNGVYHAQIQVRTGEYHFIAQDVETSGGTSDGGLTWSPGMTIYRALTGGATENTRVYWDDKTQFGSDPDATANVPGGVVSGSMADANGDGKPDGFHTWGSFTDSSFGDGKNIDTYVYGPAATAVANIAVAPNETGDSDGVASTSELGAGNFGDGNGDGTLDYLQDNVTSLPNPVAANAYNTLASSGCTTLSSVGIKSENQLSTADSKYDYPLGLFNFAVSCGTPGATAHISVYYDKVYDTSTWTARKFANGVYTNIPGAVFSTATVGGTQVTKLTYDVTDGSSLDADGSVNGTIIDPVGPGIAPNTPLTALPAAAQVAAPNTGLAARSAIAPWLLIAAALTLLAAVRIAARSTHHGHK